MGSGQNLCVDVASWGAKAALFSNGLMPVLESLGNLEDPNEEVARVAPVIQELINIDEHHEFNRLGRV